MYDEIYGKIHVPDVTARGGTRYYPEFPECREIKRMRKQWIPGPLLRFFERALGRGYENAMPQVNKTCPIVKTALRIFLDTRTGVKKLRRTSTAVKNAFYIFPVTQNGLHNLHRTSTVVKTAFSVPPDKEACMSFTGPP